MAMAVSRAAAASVAAAWLLAIAGAGGSGGGGGLPPAAATSPLPAWKRDIALEFRRGCSGRGAKEADLCTPDSKILVAALATADVDMESDAFLQAVHQVIETLRRWPPAVAGIVTILNPKQRWTRAYCDKVIGAEEFSLFKFLTPVWSVVRNTLNEMREEFPDMAAAYDRWYEIVRASKDEEAKRLMDDALYEPDPLLSRSRPWHAVHNHYFAKVIKHLFVRACRNSKGVQMKLRTPDIYGRTLVHVAASVGDNARVKALAAVFSEEERIDFVRRTDNDGYTAEDLALVGHYNRTAELLQKFAGLPAGAGRPSGPRARSMRELYPPPKPEDLARGSDVDPVCSAAAGATSISCASSVAAAAADSGGWNATRVEVPEAWMPPGGGGCFADIIDVSQFDLNIFWRHNVWHLRPLLIRRGAKFPAATAELFTRSGLLRAAGSRKVNALLQPYGDKYKNEKPTTYTIREYVNFLDERRSGNMSSALKYVFLAIQLGISDPLNFSNVVPEIFESKAEEFVEPQIYLGGPLMGSPLHHHTRSVNSLVHGTKLWFFQPPSQKVWQNEAMYAYLVRSGGAPDTLKCLQEAGDIVYVPSDWSHGTICLDDCIGIAREFNPADR